MPKITNSVNSYYKNYMFWALRDFKKKKAMVYDKFKPKISSMFHFEQVNDRVSHSYCELTVNYEHDKDTHYILKIHKR